jgi:5-hydroxyisourate hydrolase-like protein (transthyretin family)
MRRVLTIVTCAVLLPFTGVAAQAAEPVETTTTLRGTPAHAGEPTTLTARVVDATGEPVAGETVVVSRRRDGEWSPIRSVVTDEDGVATAQAPLVRTTRNNVFRAAFEGNDLDPEAVLLPSRSDALAVDLVRRKSRLRLTGPDRVVDEQSVTLQVSWVARGTGEGVAGRVWLQRRQDGRWRTIRRTRTNRQGAAELTLRPRSDVRLRVRARRLSWVSGARSPAHVIDNIPPAPPVQLPSRAPRPRINLPDQPRAKGSGPNPVVTRIPDRVWRQLTGITWHRGCPVGRAGLRLIRVNYYDYSGYRRRGELVVAAGAVGKFVGALRDIHARQLPMRSMYRVDRFGWSSRLRGGNDYKSMAAGNTSAFNCRSVVNRPGVQSPHSWGRSFDINTWENPYHSATGWVPNSWWAARSHPRVAWRSGEHPMVEILRRNGFSWTYGTSDSQHFDARTSSGRIVRPARCTTDVCH